MNWFMPKFRRNPNEKVQSLYWGVSPGGLTVTALSKVGADRNQLETSRTYEPGLQRGQGGRCGVLVIGGLETSLDEIEYILEAKKRKPFVPRRSPGEVAGMCRMLLERRNDLIRHYRKNPSEAPKRPKVQLHLPVGYRWAGTSEPGLKVLAKV